MINRKFVALTLILFLGLVVGLAGCGGDHRASSTRLGNTSKITHARASEARASQTRSELRAALGATRSGDFTASGARCSLVLVTAGASAQAYAGDPWALTSPDGQVAVKVASYQGSPESACLQAVDHVLGW